MKKNVGTVDMVVRLIVVLVIAALFAVGVLKGTLAIIAGILAVIFLVTSVIRFCPLYILLGINTNSCKDENCQSCCGK